MTGFGRQPEDETVSLAQIVAALSVSYTDVGVLWWLEAANKGLDDMSPAHFIESGDVTRVADAVRRIGDADPSDFTVTDRKAQR